MITVKLFYRDGANYKDVFDVEIDNKYINLVRKHKMCGEDDLLQMEQVGLTAKDIPIIKKYGFDSKFDHSLVTVMEVTQHD